MSAPNIEDRSVKLLQSFYVQGTCAFASSRPWQGETCAEYQSKIQGCSTPGCTWCETEVLLKEVGRLPERR